MSRTSLNSLLVLNIGYYMGLSPYRICLTRNTTKEHEAQILIGSLPRRVLSTILTSIIIVLHVGLIAFIVAYDILFPNQPTPNRILALVLSMMAMACTTLQTFFLMKNRILYFTIRTLLTMTANIGNFSFRIIRWMRLKL